jgi:hypothetical protein
MNDVSSGPSGPKEKSMAHNWHAIIGPNGMCECGVTADGTVVTCRGLLDQEIAQLGQEAEPIGPIGPRIEEVVAQDAQGHPVKAFAVATGGQQAAPAPSDGIRFDEETNTYVARHTILTAGNSYAEAALALASAIQLTAKHWPPRPSRAMRP